MTLFHLGNCVALCYVPYLLVYRFGGISEYSSGWRVGQAAFGYILTQLIKMLLLATFFPAGPGKDVETLLDTSFDVAAVADNSLSSSFTFLELLSDFMKYSVDLLDYIGLYLIMTGKLNLSLTGTSGRRGSWGAGSNMFRGPYLRCMVAGVGWAGAELVMTRFLPLWFGARGMEFDWRYVRLSFESNLLLMQHIIASMLVMLYTRYSLTTSNVSDGVSHSVEEGVSPIRAVSFLLLFTYKPLILNGLARVSGLSAWYLLGVHTMYVLSISVFTLLLYINPSTGTSTHNGKI